MSVQDFVPQVWSASLLKNLNNAHVYKKGTNNDYEGEISDYGSSVKITSIGRIAISDYTRNTDLAAPEELDMAGQIMVIDQGKTFHFAVDDVDKRQARGEFVSAAMTEASWGLADVTDLYIGTTMAGAVASANTLTAATVGNGAGEASAYEILLQMDVALSENNTPEGNRWAFVPYWFDAMLRTDERFVSFGTDSNRANLRGEAVGKAGGLTIYRTNNTPTSGSANKIIAGYSGAVTFAEQIMKTEAYTPERRFADAVKGLHVYAAKVTRPSNLAMIVATKGSYN